MDDTIYSIRELLGQSWWPFKASKTRSLIRKKRLKAFDFADEGAKQPNWKIIEKDAKDFVKSYMY